MYKTILIPIDLANAERGKAMIELAREIGGKGARFVLINVIEEVPTYVAAHIPGDILDKRKKDAVTELEDMVKAAGISAEVHVRSGRPSTAILDAAEDTGAELIVIASHRPGLEDYLLGSTAARVVRHAKCSVLVVR